MSSSDSKVVIVTGANQGIGYEAVKLLSPAHPTWKILLAARSEDKAKAAIEKLGKPANVSFLLLDVTSKDSIQAAFDKVKKDHGRVDVLIQNAGVYIADHKHESAVATFDTNVFGLKNINDVFLPIIPEKTGRIIIVSSEVGSWTHHATPAETRKPLEAIDTLQWPELNSLIQEYLASTKEPFPKKDKFADSSKSFGSYGASKLFLSVYGRILARDLKSKGITVVLSTPGYCATNLNGYGGPRSAEVGAKSVIRCLDVPLADAGKLWLDGEEVPVATPPNF